MPVQDIHRIHRIHWDPLSLLHVTCLTCLTCHDVWHTITRTIASREDDKIRHSTSFKSSVDFASKMASVLPKLSASPLCPDLACLALLAGLLLVWHLDLQTLPWCYSHSPDNKQSMRSPKPTSTKYTEQRISCCCEKEPCLELFHELCLPFHALAPHWMRGHLSTSSTKAHQTMDLFSQQVQKERLPYTWFLFPALLLPPVPLLCPYV